MCARGWRRPGLTLVSCEHASTRKEGTVPVPGLVVVAVKRS